MAPQLHNLVPHEDKDDQYWNINITNRKNKRSHIGVSEDKKLELRLGLPGDIDHHHHEEYKKALVVQADIHNSLIIKSSISSPKEESSATRNWLPNRSFVGSCNLAFQKEEPNPSLHKKKCNSHLHSNDSTDHDQSKLANCDKRAARAPVVGWPPVRSFRKNLGSNFSKFDQKKLLPPKDQLGEKEINGINKFDNLNQDHMFVKINMEGVPIGRKVDLKAYDSYEKLSYAIDELFRGLLAAQTDYSASENTEDTGDVKTVTNGEYTLVYEDNEGDRMLVGDVPWKMFVSTAKRLRVLRTIEISTLKVSSNTQMEKTPLLDSIGIVGK